MAVDVRRRPGGRHGSRFHLSRIGGIGWCACVLMWMGAVGVFGEGRIVDPEYVVDTWETDQGLPENSATAMVQSSDGYLWFGTFNGLVRFDGVNFKTWTPANAQGLPNAAVINLHLDSRSNLWVSTMGGLVVSRPGHYQEFEAVPGWKGNIVRTFSETNGNLGITSFDGRIYWGTASGLRQLPEPPGKSGFGYIGTIDSGGRFWLGQRGGFYGYWENERWHRSSLEQEIVPQFQWAVASSEGGQWVLTDEELIKIEGQEVTIRHDLRSANLSGVWRMDEDRSGRMWISSRGTHRVDMRTGDWRHLRASPGTRDVEVRFVFEDRERNHWVGTTGGGLLRVKPRVFRTFSDEDGLKSRNVRAVIETARGQFLVGAWAGGLDWISNTVVMPVPQRMQPLSTAVQCLLKDREGRIWVGYYRGDDRSSVMVMGPDERTEVPEAFKGSRNTRAIFEDTQGQIWVGMEDAIALTEGGGGGFRVFPAESVGVGEVRCFSQGKEGGDVWVGGEQGIAHYSGGTWRRVTPPSGVGIRVSSVRRIHHGAGGAVWFLGADLGLTRLQEGRWSKIGKPQGLPTEDFYHILEDGLGYWWLTSNLGILRVAAAELGASGRGKGDRLPYALYTKSDGLNSTEPSPDSQSSCMKDSNGHLWFSTRKGLSTVDPGAVRPNLIPPTLILENVSYVDSAGETRVLSPMVTSESAQSAPIVIPAGSRRLVVRLAAPSFSAPEKIRFHYRVSFDGGETVNEERLVRSLTLEFLQHGRYDFVMTAANEYGVWNPGGVRFTMWVEPQLWETVWFRMLMVGGMGGVLVAGMTVANRRRLEAARTTFRQERAVLEERARADVVIRASEQRLRLALEATSDAIWDWNLVTQERYHSPRWFTMLGYEPGDFPDGTMTWGHLVHQDDLEPTRRLIEQGLQDGLPCEAEFRMKAADGTWRWIRARGKVTEVDANGKPVRFSGTHTDITEHRLAEQRLEQEEKFNSAILNSVPGLIYLFDSGGHLVRWNEQHTKLTGYTNSELKGKHVLEWFEQRPEDRKLVEAAVRQTFETGHTEVEARLTTKDGRALPFLFSGVRITMGGEHYLAGIGIDLSDRKRSELERNELQALLTQSQKMEAIGQLAGGVAHDFNNILTAMMMHLDLLSRDPRLPVEAQESLGELQADARRAANLTRQLLMFSRRQVMRRENLDLKVSVGNLLKLLRRVIGEQVEIEYVAAERDLWIHADPVMIEQIVMNLVVNARDAMPRGGRIRLMLDRVHIDAAMALRNPETRSGDFVRIEVSDTGIGMDEATRARIFEPFFTTKETGKGTGLGLATVFGNVKQHEGWVEVETRLGLGSTFRVVLPAVVSGVVPRGPTEEAKRLPGGTESILIAEDEATVRGVIVRLLRRLGYRVMETTQATEALEMWEREKGAFDLLITDMVMPGGITGAELAETLCQRKPSLRVLLMSGYSADMVQSGVPSREGLGFLQKPFEIEVLSQQVEKLLRHKKD